MASLRESKYKWVIVGVTAIVIIAIIIIIAIIANRGGEEASSSTFTNNFYCYNYHCCFGTNWSRFMVLKQKSWIL